MDQDTLQALVKAAFPKGKQGLAVRESVSEIIQLLLQLDQQAFQYLFAPRSTQENGGKKNGSYRRKLETRFGPVDLAIPRDREGRYYPSFQYLFAPRSTVPYQRRLVDVGDVAIALYSAGLSVFATRSNSQRKAAAALARSAA